MLISMIKRSIPYNIRRVAASIISRNKMRIKVARCCNESNLLSTSLSHLTACRIYSTESDSQPRVILPPLLEDAGIKTNLFFPLKFRYTSYFKIKPYIDKEFDEAEVIQGAKYASIVISKALANKDFESLQGLVMDDMIEILSEKIETLSPNQRQLIELKKNDIMFYVLTDIEATTGSEHSIEITTVGCYIPGDIEKDRISIGFAEYIKSSKYLICNYQFTRKYVNNVGGPWIATWVNHFSAS